MSGDGAGLLSRRLLLVTGKGGVGKSSVAAALGCLAARRGMDTVVIEVGGDASALGLLAPPGTEPSEGDGRTPTEISPHLFALRLDPESALKEYLELQLRIRTLARAVLATPGFRRLLDAAPGWRELITLGKLWHLESQRDGERPRWDLLVVDAPATGRPLLSRTRMA